MAGGRKHSAAVSSSKAPEDAPAPPAPRLGDWRSANTTHKSIKEMQREGLLPPETERRVRIGKKEEVPNPRANERVIFADHVSRGLSLPLHPFFVALLYVCGIQLHDLPPNAVQHISCFIVLCECFLGIRPHWGLWKALFKVRSFREKSRVETELGETLRTGGFEIQEKSDSSYFEMHLIDSAQGWRKK